MNWRFLFGNIILTILISVATLHAYMIFNDHKINTNTQPIAVFETIKTTKTLENTPKSSSSLLEQIETEMLGTLDIVKPAVVSIVISKEFTRLKEDATPRGRTFWGQPYGYDADDFESTVEKTGGGSGFFVGTNGLIMTNKHVVDETDALYTVLTDTGLEYEARVVAKDRIFDIALMQIDNPNNVQFPTLTLDEENTLQVGQTVIAIGNALAEYQGSVTRGIISGLERTAHARSKNELSELDNMIQVDVAINPGNSGGPLLDINGQVIGINTAVAKAENIGFALPSNIAAEALTSYRETGMIKRPFMGLEYVQITPQQAKQYNLPFEYGIWVSKVLPDSASSQAGIEPEDILLSLDDQFITKEFGLRRILKNFSIDQTIKAEIYKASTEKVEIIDVIIGGY
jgi:S1-C subfamily serine protease